VLDSVVQEIDIPTGLVLYQWDSLDHVPVSYSYQPPPKEPGHPWDYFHVNSVQVQPGGDLLISSRDDWSAYDVSRRTGAVKWTVGGKHSSFKMGPNTQFAFQHDIRMRADGELTVFDDGAGPPAVHKQSRALTLKLDRGRMTATLVGQEEHTPALLAFYEGNFQRLPGGDAFVGWGQRPYLTEYDSSGHEVFDARFVGNTDSYRAYRFRWSGRPVTAPALALRSSGGRVTAYVSWNGTTDTARWRVLGGSSARGLAPVETVAKTGFETAIPVNHAYSFVKVQALAADGHVQATWSLGRS
jgi:hypothetical protein